MSIPGLDDHIEREPRVDEFEEVEVEEDGIECPDCGSADTYPDKGDDNTVWCNNCGANIDVQNNESRDASWEVELTCTLGEMSKTEAMAYLDEMCDHIHHATGHRLYIGSIR